MFEPCHGSAPDIAGRGIANPVAALLALEMMLAELSEEDAALAVGAGVREVVAAGQVRTPDMGGSSSTVEMGEEIARVAAECAAASP